MTQPNKPASAKVKPCDREAAVEAVRAIVENGFVIGCCAMSEVDGDEFASGLSPAFAAHREAAIAPLAEAIGPLIAFIDAFDAKPLSGMADDFYSIHMGTEWGASLRFSDLRNARAALSKLRGE